MNTTQARDAAVLIVARDAAAGIEVYMLRRSSAARAFPDAYVFPGGAVDEADRSPAARAQLAGPWHPEEHEYTYAAIRETFEECGLLFADAPVDARRLRAARAQLLAKTQTFAEVVDELGVRLDAQAVRYYARRVAPPHSEHRFDARFFVAAAPPDQAAEADEGETSGGRWVLPAEMVAAAEAQTLRIQPPTILYLRRLAEFPDAASLLAFAAEQRTIEPDRRS
jgi:8-oxo-dGTP pyrophosphatase MutT (NUDIX family)